MIFITRFVFIVVSAYAGTSLLAFAKIAGCDIDVGLLALVVLSTIAKPSSTVGWGAFSGFLVDCLSPEWMGAGIAARATATMFLASMREKLNIYNPVWDGVVIFAAGVIDRAMFLGFTQYRADFLFALVRYVVPSALYTALVAVIVIFLFNVRHFITPKLS